MISRRSLFRNSGLAALSSAVWPSWMPRMIFRNEQQPANGDVLVVVFARGGYDGLNMVIPYGEEGLYFDYRPAIGIPAPDSNAAIKASDLDGFFGMHPVLAGDDEGRWKQWYDEGILGIVHAVHQQDPTRSHFDAMDYMERGTPGEKTLNSGWLGRHLSTMASLNNSPFRAVGIGAQLQASLRGPVPAVALQSIAEFHLQGRQQEIARFQQHLQELYGGDGWLDKEGQATFAALDLLNETINNPDGYRPDNGAVYNDDRFATGLKQIAQLVKAEIGLEVACVDIGGWDTHANQVDAGDPTAGNMANLMRSLSQGLTAFITDLWSNFDPRNDSAPGITIAVMSEFGRRARENGGRGTDHGHGNAMYLFGKGINGGKVYSRWPGLDNDSLDRGDLKGTTEYRDVLAELLSKRLGNTAVGDVFPNHAFNYLGLATQIEGPVPTPQPTDPPPEPTEPPVEVPKHEIFLPWGNKG